MAPAAGGWRAWIWEEETKENVAFPAEDTQFADTFAIEGTGSADQHAGTAPEQTPLNTPLCGAENPEHAPVSCAACCSVMAATACVVMAAICVFESTENDAGGMFATQAGVKPVTASSRSQTAHAERIPEQLVGCSCASWLCVNPVHCCPPIFASWAAVIIPTACVVNAPTCSSESCCQARAFAAATH